MLESGQYQVSNNIPSGHLEDNSITKWSLLNGHRYIEFYSDSRVRGVRMVSGGNILRFYQQFSNYLRRLFSIYFQFWFTVNVLIVYSVEM